MHLNWSNVAYFQYFQATNPGREKKNRGEF